MTGPIFPPMTERPEEVWVDVPRKVYVAMPHGLIEMSEVGDPTVISTRLPTVYDGVPNDWPGIKDGSKSYPFLALARKRDVSYGAVLAAADSIRNGYGVFEPMCPDLYMEVAAICRMVRRGAS